MSKTINFLTILEDCSKLSPLFYQTGCFATLLAHFIVKLLLYLKQKGSKMKKITMSIISVLALSQMAFAGGDIGKNVVESEAEVVVIPETADESAFYVGLGYSYMNLDFDGGKESGDIDGNGMLVLAGYNFNKYIAVEARYSKTFGDLSYESDYGYNEDFDGEISNYGLYLKPMYPVGGVTLYGLLGYGKVTYEEGSSKDSESGFQWGIGASYAVNDNWGLFVDYTRLYDDQGFDDIPTYYDIMIDSVNVGVTYTF